MSFCLLLCLCLSFVVVVFLSFVLFCLFFLFILSLFYFSVWLPLPAPRRWHSSSKSPGCDKQLGEEQWWPPKTISKQGSQKPETISKRKARGKVIEMSAPTYQREKDMEGSCRWEKRSCMRSGQTTLPHRVPHPSSFFSPYFTSSFSFLLYLCLICANTHVMFLKALFIMSFL